MQLSFWMVLSFFLLHDFLEEVNSFILIVLACKYLKKIACFNINKIYMKLSILYTKFFINIYVHTINTSTTYFAT